MLNSEIQILLPFPPTLNGYYSQNRHTRYLSRGGRLYAEKVETAMHEQGLRGLSLTDSLHVEVILFPPDKRTRDLDNYMKALLDSLTRASLWEDDSQIDQLMIYRGRILKSGLCMVNVTEAGPQIPVPSFAKVI